MQRRGGGEVPRQRGLYNTLSEQQKQELEVKEATNEVTMMIMGKCLPKCLRDRGDKMEGGLTEKEKQCMSGCTASFYMSTFLALQTTQQFFAKQQEANRQAQRKNFEI
eukprot:TRINITY_DN2228_c0_g1_i2.p1 TRINITY_DN2228_c0_g1~~TRINITY_DN2228_c0_g1_i2.p1  ORF type:complete len:108 (+),score=42.57 TRINITY_DN2228_c0_g1_i2:87-410(+)